MILALRIARFFSAINRKALTLKMSRVERVLGAVDPNQPWRWHFWCESVGLGFVHATYRGQLLDGWDSSSGGTDLRCLGFRSKEGKRKSKGTEMTSGRRRETPPRLAHWNLPLPDNEGEQR
jgi:hypothetical protein